MTSRDGRLSLAALLAVASAACATKILATSTSVFAFLPQYGVVRPTVYYAFDVAVSLALLLWLGGARLADVWQAVGARAPGRVSLALAAIFAPVAAVAAWRAGVARDLHPEAVLFSSLVAPFFEELVYRGLAVGVLMRLAGWRFLPAALATSVVFGLSHVLQGESWGAVVTIVLFTAIGGLWFGWVYVRTGFNLWPPFVLHAGMNAVWAVFGLGQTAVGGRLGNGLRVLVIVASIVIVRRMTRGSAGNAGNAENAENAENDGNAGNAGNAGSRYVRG